MFTKINQQIINGSLLRRRSYGSSRNISSPTRKERLGKKDCVTSHKNACVGGYINAGSLDFDNTNFSLSGVDVTKSSVKNNLEISWVKTKKIEWKGLQGRYHFSGPYYLLQILCKIPRQVHNKKRTYGFHIQRLFVLSLDPVANYWQTRNPKNIIGWIEGPQSVQTVFCVPSINQFYRNVGFLSYK